MCCCRCCFSFFSLFFRFLFVLSLSFPSVILPFPTTSPSVLSLLPLLPLPLNHLFSPSPPTKVVLTSTKTAVPITNHPPPPPPTKNAFSLASPRSRRIYKMSYKCSVFCTIRLDTDLCCESFSFDVFLLFGFVFFWSVLHHRCCFCC